MGQYFHFIFEILATEKRAHTRQRWPTINFRALVSYYRKIRKRKCYSWKKINSGPALASYYGKIIEGKIRKRKCYSRKNSCSPSKHLALAQHLALAHA
jgi:hypothetical protein